MGGRGKEVNIKKTSARSGRGGSSESIHQTFEEKKGSEEGMIGGCIPCFPCRQCHWTSVGRREYTTLSHRRWPTRGDRRGDRASGKKEGEGRASLSCLGEREGTEVFTGPTHALHTVITKPGKGMATRKRRNFLRSHAQRKHMHSCQKESICSLGGETEKTHLGANG